MLMLRAVLQMGNSKSTGRVSMVPGGLPRGEGIGAFLFAGPSVRRQTASARHSREEEQPLLGRVGGAKSASTLRAF